MFIGVDVFPPSVKELPMKDKVGKRLEEIGKQHSLGRIGLSRSKCCIDLLAAVIVEFAHHSANIDKSPVMDESYQLSYPDMASVILRHNRGEISSSASMSISRPPGHRSSAEASRTG